MLAMPVEIKATLPSLSSVSQKGCSQPIQELYSLVERIFKERVIGPVLNFEGQDIKERRWGISMLFGIPPWQKKLPNVSINRGGKNEQVIAKEILRWENFRFYRCDLTTQQQTSTCQRVAYKIGRVQHHFHVPAIAENAKLFFTSCNGVQSVKTIEKYRACGGLQHLWDAIKSSHNQEPAHINIMAGDQVYMDGMEELIDPLTNQPTILTTGVLTLPSILKWLSLPEARRDAHPFTEEMRQELEAFYMCKYMLHFFHNGSFSNILARVPSLMLAGDHDFYDGVGSYPKSLQNSPVLKGIFSVGQAAYMLFQQQRALSDPTIQRSFFGKAGFSSLKLIDNGTMALLLLDTRTERTRQQIIAPETWKMVFEKLKSLPSHCKHLLVLLETPIIFPSLKYLGEALKGVEGPGLLRRAARGMLSQISDVMNSFDLVEIADDLDDGWGAKRHEEETKRTLTDFKDFAKKHDIKVTFLGGDDHFGTTGISVPDAEDVSYDDPRVMYQCVSSAVVNTPPPGIAIEAAKLYMEQKTARIAQDINTSMIPIKKEYGDGEPKEQLVLAKRNFAVIQQKGEVLSWRLYVEPKDGRVKNLSSYCLNIPECTKKRITRVRSPHSTVFVQLSAKPESSSQHKSLFSKVLASIKRLFKHIINLFRQMRIYWAFRGAGV